MEQNNQYIENLKNLDWLKIGTSFQSTENQKLPIKQEKKIKKDKKRKKDKKDKKDKKKKKDKKEKKEKKEKKRTKEIELTNNEQQLVPYLAPKQYPNDNFHHKVILAPNLLPISLECFGDNSVQYYGYRQYEVPNYIRVEANIIVGLGSNVYTYQILSQLASKQGLDRPQEQVRRYFQHQYNQQQQKQNKQYKQHSQQQVKYLSQTQPTSYSLNEDYIQFKDKIEVYFNQPITLCYTPAVPPGLHNYSTSNMSAQDIQVYLHTKHFNQMLRQQSDNEQLWLQYVQYQDQLYQHNSQRIFCLEKKQAILAKAINNLPHSTILIDLKAQIDLILSQII